MKAGEKLIRAILFDFDGVLTVDQTGSVSITGYLARRTGLPLERIRQCYYPFNKALLYGEITHEEMWPEFCAALGRNIDDQLLIDSFVSTPLDEEMVALVKKLKSNYLIGMVTDNKCDRIETILRRTQLDQYFDAVGVSAALKSGKAKPFIFEYVLEQLHVTPAECVFIDNTARNLAVPEKMGMKTILFDDQKRNIEEFTEELYGLIRYCEGRE